MTVLNPNFNFPDKNKSKKQGQERRGGSVTVTNIKCAYDFRPIRNVSIFCLMRIGCKIIIKFFFQREVYLYVNR